MYAQTMHVTARHTQQPTWHMQELGVQSAPAPSGTCQQDLR